MQIEKEYLMLQKDNQIVIFNSNFEEIGVYKCSFKLALLQHKLLLNLTNLNQFITENLNNTLETVSVISDYIQITHSSNQNCILDLLKET